MDLISKIRYTTDIAIQTDKSIPIIIYSVYLISIGKMEVGTIILVYTYYDKIITNFEVLGTISAEYQSFLVSWKRINKLGENSYLENDG